MKNLIFLFAGCFFAHLSFSQTTPTPAPRLVDFTVSPNGNAYQFTPLPPVLQQKAGAPPAFWTYYWEFGDGHFSFEQNPSHVYKTRGTHQPLLEATAHYDVGDPPNGKSRSLLAERNGTQTGLFPTAFDSAHLPIQMKPSRQARPREALTCLISYRNLGTVRTDGRLHFFFNERKFSGAHFVFDSARAHFNERLDASVSAVLPLASSPTDAWAVLHLPSDALGGLLSATDRPTMEAPPTPAVLLANARGAYREEKTWRFDNLLPGESRNMFLSLRGTNNMLQDTNAFVHWEAVFVPFDPQIAPERFELEFEIVSSHDPNAIIVSDSRVNYRSVGSKKLDYKVQFQNNGEGPASTVELKIEIPEGLDMQRMRPVEWYPKCAICPKTPGTASCLDTASSKEGLLFTFRNIYLPGTRQKGLEDRDSTKGFVRYRIESERDMPKRSFRSRAKITFDKNAPIYTNYTRTRFKVGLSPGVKLGYGFEPNLQNSDAGENEAFVQAGYPFLGLSLSPYKSWRVYPQVELLTGIKGQTLGPKIESNAVDTIFHNTDIDTLSFKRITSQSSSGHVSFELPVLLRKNFGRFVGLGLGGSCHVLLFNEKTVQETNEMIVVQIVGQDPQTLSSTQLPATTNNKRSTRLRYSAFADLSLGSVRKGLNLGIRGGALLETNRKMRPFVQLSLEFKM